jgi:uncharacterized protein YpmB
MSAQTDKHTERLAAAFPSYQMHITIIRQAGVPLIQVKSSNMNGRFDFYFIRFKVN